MVATLSFIQEKFKEYNALMFDNKLPMLPIRMGNARTSLGGVCYSKKRSWLGKIRFENFRMVISTRFDLSQREIEDTLIHEMIHYYILYHQIHDTSPHGEVFLKMMKAINTQYGRNVSVSHRMNKDTADKDTRIKAHYFCISTLQDGRLGITVAAKTRVFDLWRQLPQCFPITKMTWYGSTDVYFNRFPCALKPKIYLVDEAELCRHLQDAVELENDGRTIRAKKS